MTFLLLSRLNFKIICKCLMQMGNGSSQSGGLGSYGGGSQGHGMQDDSHWGSLGVGGRSGMASSLTSSYYSPPGLMGPVPPRHQAYYGW